MDLNWSEFALLCSSAQTIALRPPRRFGGGARPTRLRNEKCQILILCASIRSPWGHVAPRRPRENHHFNCKSSLKAHATNCHGERNPLECSFLTPWRPRRLKTISLSTSLLSIAERKSKHQALHARMSSEAVRLTGVVDLGRRSNAN